jgi:hypothetical protein
LAPPSSQEAAPIAKRLRRADSATDFMMRER